MNHLQFGLAFDPFAYLDSTRDARLHEYLVIPKTVEIAWDDASLAIFAQPGGGKSALRTYTEMIYRRTRGVKLPITYVPDTFSLQKEFHFFGLRRSLARSVFIYLTSYPDTFLQLTPSRREQAIQLMADLPFQLDFILSILENAASIAEIEQVLGIGAISGIEKPGRAHREMVSLLRRQRAKEPRNASLPDLLDQARDVFGIKSFHILFDGLDGFAETRQSRDLLEWIEPLFRVAGDWAQKSIYLKFFLPITACDIPDSLSRHPIRTAELTWDDGLLAEVIRRRLYVASGGAFDSLDALATPDLRNIELQLARQLNAEKKLPRQMIKTASTLLELASHNADHFIHPIDMLITEEGESHVIRRI